MLAGTGLVGTKECWQLLHLSRMLELDLTDFFLSSGVSTGVVVGGADVYLMPPAPFSRKE